MCKKRRVLKRWISVVTTILCVTAMTFVPGNVPVEAVAGPNLIRNSSFERLSGGLPEDWSVDNPYSDFQNYTYEYGENFGRTDGGVRISQKENEGFVILKQENIPVTSNTDYLFEYWFKAENVTANGRLQVCIRQFNADGYDAENSYLWTDTYNQWGNTDGFTKVSIPFTTSSNSVKLRIEIYVNVSGGGSGDWYFDDVSLHTPDPNPIRNSDFEEASGNVPAVWIFNNGEDSNITWKRDVSGGRNGSAAVHVKRAVKSSTLSNINSPDIKVKPSTEYVLEYWLKSKNVTNLGNLTVMLKQKTADGWDSSENCYYYLNDYEQYGDTDWKKVTVPFTTASDAAKIDLFFHFVGDSTGRYGSTGEYWIDDVTLRTKTEYEADTEQYAGMIEVNVTPAVKGMANGYYEAVSVAANIKTENAGFREATDVFKNYVKSVHGIELSESEGGISLVLDESLAEGTYKLRCNENGLTVKASSTEAINYALSTVLQIMKPNANGSFDFPVCDVTDYPDTEYRSLMSTLHVGEHREGVVKTELSRILDYIDLCYLNKINYLHFDFNQYGYYALPSEAFPELPTDSHYTKEDITVMNAYAKARGITIIPAINAPGHATEFMLKYPEVFGGYTETGYYDTYEQQIGILDCSEETFAGLKKIYEEVCELFPDSPYIHLGGDEAPTTLWYHSEKTKAYAKEQGLTDASGNMDLKALYTEFIYRITEMVLDMGRTPIVWEGFPTSGNHKISKDVIVAEWECAYNLPEDLIEAGYKFTNVSWQPLYIASEQEASWDYKEILKWNIYNWQHFYEGSAALGGMVIDPSDYVIGAEMPVWRYRAGDDATYTEIMERLPALAQKTWNIRGNFSFAEFVRSLELNSAILKKMNTADRSVKPLLEGDINGDDEVNIKDLVRLKKIEAGISQYVPAADMNLDGNVNAADIALLKKYLCSNFN